MSVGEHEEQPVEPVASEEDVPKEEETKYDGGPIPPVESTEQEN